MPHDKVKAEELGKVARLQKHRNTRGQSVGSSKADYKTIFWLGAPQSNLNHRNAMMGDEQYGIFFQLHRCKES